MELKLLFLFIFILKKFSNSFFIKFFKIFLLLYFSLGNIEEIFKEKSLSSKFVLLIIFLLKVVESLNLSFSLSLLSLSFSLLRNKLSLLISNIEKILSDKDFAISCEFKQEISYKYNFIGSI